MGRGETLLFMSPIQHSSQAAAAAAFHFILSVRGEAIENKKNKFSQHFILNATYFIVYSMFDRTLPNIFQ